MALPAVRIHIHHLITPAFFGQDWGRIFITDGVIFPDGFHNHALTVQLERHAFTDQQGGLQRTGLITHLAITSKALTLSSREKKRSSLIKISFSLLLIFRKNDKNS